jgi:hypothetical protein
MAGDQPKDELVTLGSALLVLSGPRSVRGGSTLPESEVYPPERGEQIQELARIVLVRTEPLDPEFLVVWRTRTGSSSAKIQRYRAEATTSD